MMAGNSPEVLTEATDAESELARLISIMAALRTPVTGCPWDLEQDFRTVAPYTIEEAHEVADAIERDDMLDLVDELGDLLLQVVFHARMAEEAGHFAMVDVIRAINAKMIRRHPHVFGDATARTAGMVKSQWEQIKAQERAEKAARRKAARLPENGVPSLLEKVSASLPAAQRAVKLQAEAGKVGFDWNNPKSVIAKLREELAEVEATLDGPVDKQREEIGDLMFAMANLSRHLAIDPDAALRGANQKFIRRFRFIEAALAHSGSSPQESSLEEMDALWNLAKQSEKT